MAFGFLKVADPIPIADQILYVISLVTEFSKQFEIVLFAIIRDVFRLVDNRI